MLLWDKLKQYQEGNLSYNEQVSLFFEFYPEKRSALESFFKNNDQFSRNRLNKGLQEKIQEQEAKQKENSFKNFSRNADRKKKINVELLPDELRKEYNRLGPLIGEIAHSHARLYYCSTNEQRFEVAKVIIHKGRQMRAIWQQLDEFESTGKVSEVCTVVIEKVDPTRLKNFEAEHQLKLLRARRSKAKNDPSKKALLDSINKEIEHWNSKRYL